MKLAKLSEFKRGWIVGDFDPSLLKDDFEVGIQSYSVLERHERHFHKIATEINLVLEGLCLFTIDNTEYILGQGDIIVVEPNEETEFYAVSNCRILCIKSKSVRGDKYES